MALATPIRLNTETAKGSTQATGHVSGPIIWYDPHDNDSAESRWYSVLFYINSKFMAVIDSKDDKALHHSFVKINNQIEKVIEEVKSERISMVVYVNFIKALDEILPGGSMMKNMVVDLPVSYRKRLHYEGLYWDLTRVIQTRDSYHLPKFKTIPGSSFVGVEDVSDNNDDYFMCRDEPLKEILFHAIDLKVKETLIQRGYKFTRGKQSLENRFTDFMSEHPKALASRLIHFFEDHNMVIGKKAWLRWMDNIIYMIDVLEMYLTEARKEEYLVLKTGTDLIASRMGVCEGELRRSMRPVAPNYDSLRVLSGL